MWIFLVFRDPFSFGGVAVSTGRTKPMALGVTRRSSGYDGDEVVLLVSLEVFSLCVDFPLRKKMKFLVVRRCPVLPQRVL